MSVRIQLDTPHAHFTNLDFISGRVYLQLLHDESVSSIVVKLEGESKTRLAAPRAGFNEQPDRKKFELEFHKLLYKVAEVFPSPEVKAQSSATAAYTLRPGIYEYPFNFKLPFNNDCSSTNSLYSNLNFAGVRMEFARDTDRHVKNTLPPTLTGLRGEASIEYYVKVTVVRPQFFRENRRARANFKFLPIEPPRPQNRKEETYARRQHQFTAALLSAPQKKGMFSGLKDSSSQVPSEPPRFSVDARLPNPPILTCNEPLPLRLLVQRLSQSPEPVHLAMLQIELIGHTHVRAHQLSRQETASWVLVSLSNLGITLGKSSDPVGTEITVDDKFWKNVPLPNTVAPSFETCNITRTYEVEIRVGLQYGSSKKPELIILPLRHVVQVYSGIAPPPSLLAAMANAPVTPAKSSNPPRTATTPFGHTPIPTTPMTPSYTSHPPQVGEISSASVGDAAPPSYEDAMAEDIGPVDGRRRTYDVAPPLPERADSMDGKGVLGQNSSNERLPP
ncbi:MAG: hypothetical protein M1825_005057 [Sarcosagium campestre]|nr:MAG: hypothetical protein M1825_005057 [Sarcosagium campestre]